MDKSKDLGMIKIHSFVTDYGFYLGIKYQQNEAKKMPQHRPKHKGQNNIFNFKIPR